MGKWIWIYFYFRCLFCSLLSAFLTHFPSPRATPATHSYLNLFSCHFLDGIWLKAIDNILQRHDIIIAKLCWRLFSALQTMKILENCEISNRIFHGGKMARDGKGCFVPFSTINFIMLKGFNFLLLLFFPHLIWIMGRNQDEINDKRDILTTIWWIVKWCSVLIEKEWEIFLLLMKSWEIHIVYLSTFLLSWWTTKSEKISQI